LVREHKVKMIPYHKEPSSYLQHGDKRVASFVSEGGINSDQKTVESFGEEWSKFDAFSEEDLRVAGDQYFDIITDKMVNKDTVALDVGCGTARWSRYISSKVKFVEGIDPSKAVFSAMEMTKDLNNVRITQADTDSLPFADESFDFVFSLGVLHHIPDTEMAMIKSVKKLKKDGYFLVYLYYRFDQRSILFKSVFYLSHFIRLITSKLPAGLKKFTCDVIAVTVYMPMVYLTKLVKTIAPKSKAYTRIPLSYYADKSFNIIRNDSLDRFGTPLEQRFTKVEIEAMMKKAGLTDITFSNNEPYWHAVGRKA